jgi:mannosyl-oligosaccharide alpha-1,2-mannosidase
MEWTRLSDLTGDPEYANLAQRAESYLLKPTPPTAEPFPGLVGTNINIATGQFADNRGGWNGGDDSFYEYLIKMYVYNPVQYAAYRDRWEAAADSTIKYLTSKPASRPDVTFVAGFSGTKLSLASQHLACFDGGNFLLGGRALGRSDYVEYGLALTAGCRNTYISTATGIGPEQFGWNANTVPDGQADFFKQNGFYITSGAYILRPEVVESYYYAYRTTGQTQYQDWSWEAFVAINATCRTPSGFTGIANVNAPDGGGALDLMESFTMAEMFKYLYMIHAPEAPWQVNVGGGGQGLDQWVFNTEAHPFKTRS